MIGAREEKIWCLAQIKPNAEGAAERNLLRQGFGVFVPKILRTGRFRGRFRDEKRALFPGYLFVSMRAGLDRWRAISSTLGVSRLVSFGGDRPSIVPSDIVELLRRRCDDPERFPSGQLGRGDAVRVTSGPFADFVGNIESIPSAQRIWVLLEIMGQGRRISISARDVQPAVS